ncbi:MAG: polymerase sigma factor, sigma-70 family [Deltaproteobacteria bacterium]|nr:polymerase sigma factor, sigma-70 family [Deltaproteobacteria bacterium]
MTAAVKLETRTRREIDDLTLARAQQGDAAAFRVLVETYQDAVFALVWRFLGRHAQLAVVEDVAQVAFLGIFRSLPRFRIQGEARLSTWILTIAARTALKERRGDPRPTVQVDELAEVLASTDSSDQGVDHRAFVEALGRALAALAPPYRAAFLLREYHGFEYEEIATALEIDLGTVKSRLSRARSQLREELKEFAP